MTTDTDATGMDAKIRLLKATALELQSLGAGIPAVEKNVTRMLASIAMLELNVSDVVEAA